MPAINLVDTVPAFVTQEEYSSIAASTPNSFNDLPAILKYQANNVSVNIQPPVQGFSDEDAARGILYVLTSVLVFVSSTGRSFQVEYRSITLHALSRSPQPSVYCQLDDTPAPEAPALNGAPATQSSTLNETNGEDEEGESGIEEEFTDMKELTIIPDSAASLDPIFEALSECAALHPDKSSDDEDMEDAMIDDDSSPFEVFNGDGDEELSEVGKAALAHLESIIYDPFTPKDDGEHNAVEKENSEGEEALATTGERSVQLQK